MGSHPDWRSPGPRLLVLGVDGATWRLLDPLIAQGRLPAFARLRREGSSGVLHSAALNSPLLWTTIFTGKRPEKHGVQFFGATARDVRVPRLWEILDGRGIPVGVCGTLVTWPPRAVNGFLIPDLFALGPETHPPEYRLLQELALEEKKAPGRRGLHAWHTFGVLTRWGVSPATWTAVAQFFLQSRLRRPVLDRYWRKVLLQPRLYADVFLGLCRRYRPAVAFFHFHATDTISHRYWRYIEPERFPDTPGAAVRRFRQVIPSAYAAADAVLARLLSLAGPETSVIVLSDHGFEARPVGRFKYDLRFEHLLSLLELTGAVIPARLSNTFVLQFRAPVDVQAIASRLGAFRVAASGEPLFRIREVAPDRVSFLLADLDRRWNGTGLRVPGKGDIAFEELFEDRGFVDSGQHAPEGVLLLRGPAIRPGHTLEGATIYDITPTALHLCGVPVGADMDGRVLTEAMTEEFLREHPLETISSHDPPDAPGRGAGEESLPEGASDRIIDRLKSLGYL